MTAKKTAKPRGRPPVPPEKKKRRNFTFRGSDELHEHLVKAAAKSGRSISEEIEWRAGSAFHTEFVIERTVERTLQRVFAYINDVLAKEDAERRRLRPLSDLANPEYLKSIIEGGDK